MRTLFLILISVFIISNVDAQIFHEDFENPDSVTYSGTGGGWAQNGRLAMSGMFCDSASILNPGDSVMMSTIPVDLSFIGSVFLCFDHICKIELFDSGKIQCSLDGGVSWVYLVDEVGGAANNCNYLGNSTFSMTGSRFHEASYSNWYPVTTMLPDSTWWKHEVIDVSAIAGFSPQIQFRFVLTDDNNSGSGGRSGWYIDDIVLSDSLDINSSQYINRLTGKMFVDLNSNLVQDAGDPPVEGQWIQANNSSTVSTTMNDGFYNVNVLTTGPVTITPYPWYYSSTYYTLSPSTHSANFLGLGNLDSLNDFAYQPTGTFDDLSIFMMSYNQYYKPGAVVQHQLFYKNRGTTFQNATIVFYPDNALTYISSPLLTPTSISTDSIVWNISNLAPLQYNQIAINFSVDTSITAGTLLSSNGIIYPITGDFDPSNNTDNISNLTVASWDPNAITVDKEVIYTPDLISPPELNYTIYFQNTGTDTAYYIRVHNMIPSELDINTYELISTSHTVALNFDSATRLMQYTFNNILLPDSNTNESASHGFISYRIKPLSTLVDGDSIKSVADIYFDFNAPVITNTAITTIEDPLSINEGQVEWDKLKVFPNPVTDKITVSFESGKQNNISIELFNIYGQKVQTLYSGPKNSGMHQEQFDVSELNAGVYFLRHTNENGYQTTRFVKWSD